MKVFFKNGLLFLIFFLIFAEILSRVLHITTDAPKTYKNENGNVNYLPNQVGYWDGGKHKWFINSMGYPGKNLPESYDNLILLIGDSYIQNFMNPDSCRQSAYLKELDSDYNFMEVAMDGLNLLGYFEYSKPLDSLAPLKKIIYVNNRDFRGDVYNGKDKGPYQVNLQDRFIYYPKYKGSKFKDFIYNFKFLYYLYRKNLKLINPNVVEINNEIRAQKNNEQFNFKEIKNLLEFIKINYRTDNVILIFHPNSNRELVSFVKNIGFKVYEIQKPENENWATEKDGHWNCEAHKKIAEQVDSVLKSSL